MDYSQFTKFQKSFDNQSENINFVNHLYELVHASKCSQISCPFLFCLSVKNKLSHMNSCRMGFECIQHCFKSKVLYNHWHCCNKVQCEMCCFVQSKINFHSASESMFNQQINQETGNHDSRNLDKNNSASTSDSNEIIDLTLDDFHDNSRELNFNQISQATENQQQQLSQNVRQANSFDVLQSYYNPGGRFPTQNYPTLPLMISPVQTTPVSDSMPMDYLVNTRVRRHCRKCAIHGRKMPVKYHRICPFKNCPCQKCNRNSVRRSRNFFLNTPNLVPYVPEVATNVTFNETLTEIENVNYQNNGKVHYEGSKYERNFIFLYSFERSSVSVLSTGCLGARVFECSSF